MLNKIRFLKEKFLEVEKEMLKPEVIANSKKYSELCKEYNELARKDYYRKELGMSKLSSWLKAKNERWLFKERGKKTEEEITRLEILRTEAQIDRRTLKIKENLEKQKRIKEKI